MNPALIQALTGMMVSGGAEAAILQTAMGAAQRAPAQIGNMANRGGYGMASTAGAYGGGSVGAVAQDAMKRGSGVVGAGLDLANPLSSPMSKLNSLGDIAKELVTMPSTIRDWGDELQKSQEHLAKFNGVIAGVMARSQHRSIKRAMKAGDATSGSTDHLVERLDALRDTVEPITSDIKNIAQVVIGELSQFANIGLTAMRMAIASVPMFSGVARDLEMLLKILRGPEGGKSPAMDFIDYIVKGGLTTREPIGRSRPYDPPGERPGDGPKRIEELMKRFYEGLEHAREEREKKTKPIRERVFPRHMYADPMTLSSHTPRVPRSTDIASLSSYGGGGLMSVEPEKIVSGMASGRTSLPEVLSTGRKSGRKLPTPWYDLPGARTRSKWGDIHLDGEYRRDVGHDAREAILARVAEKKAAKPTVHERAARKARERKARLGIHESDEHSPGLTTSASELDLSRAAAIRMRKREAGMPRSHVPRVKRK